ncbi:MAG: DUF167 domain-containing protein [Desulfobacteraceae bacterium]|nr:DUF167 domain-containing protein [Desulfobacteraceae bacterium]
MFELKTSSKGIIFKVYVQPRASANQTAGCRKDALKIRLTAPPSDGEANRACVKLLAKELKLPKSDIEIISGGSGREKKILVHIQDTGQSKKTAENIKKRLEILSAQKSS